MAKSRPRPEPVLPTSVAGVPTTATVIVSSPASSPTVTAPPDTITATQKLFKFLAVNPLSGRLEGHVWAHDLAAAEAKIRAELTRGIHVSEV